MRITGGKYRSRVLLTPDVASTKPTMDKVRQAVFSILYDVNNKVVLDLFAGSGSFGLEALSRGANKAIFIENNKEAISSITNNIKNLKEENNTNLICGDSLSKINEIDKESIDIIYVDPPYQKYNYIDIFNKIIDSKIMKNDGIYILESDKDLDFSSFSEFSVRKYNYGLSKITILRRK